MSDPIQVYDGKGEPPRPRFPKNVAEAVQWIIENLKADGDWETFIREAQEYKKEHPDDGRIRISLHHTTGRWIRNNFGLWSENSPLLDDCQKYASPEIVAWMEKNKTNKVHPDDASGVIIDALMAKVLANP